MTTETNYITEVANLNSEIGELEAERNGLAKQALKQLAKDAFDADPELKNFAFGISGREYNDEGLYEGINEVVNNVDENDIYSSYWNKYYGDPSRGSLATGLSTIGEQALVDTFGEYDIVIVYRDGRVEVIDAGY